MDKDQSEIQLSGDVADNPTLSSRTLQLIGQLEDKSPKLAQMLAGCWLVIQKPLSLESYVHSAHSARELMEKAPIFMPDVPVRQGNKKLTQEVRALHEAWKVIKTGQWSGAPPWKGEIDSPLDGWLSKAEEFFSYFATNHQTRKEQTAAAIQALDRSGQPLPEHMIAEKVKDWGNLNDYFQSIAHHGSVAREEEFESHLEELELFLLELIHPEPIPVMDEIDALIAEGETS